MQVAHELLAMIVGIHNNEGDPYKRSKLDTVFASPDIGPGAFITNPLPVHFCHIERFQSYPDKRVNGVMTAYPLALRGDPLFADGISLESSGNIAFAATPDDLFVQPVEPTNRPDEEKKARAGAYSCVVNIKLACPFVGVCNSMTARSGFANFQQGDMAIDGITKLIAHFKTRVYAGLPLILTPYASSMFAKDKTGTVAGRNRRLIAQAIVAGSDEFFPGDQSLCTNFNMFAVCGFSVNSFMDGFTVGTAYIEK